LSTYSTKDVWGFHVEKLLFKICNIYLVAVNDLPFDESTLISQQVCPCP
jgi:hypothetical protein